MRLDRWDKILLTYDISNEDEAGPNKMGKSLQSIAVILLMYLALGKDYPYHIAKVFNKLSQTSNTFNRSGGSILLSGSKISGLLKKMAADEIGIAKADRRPGRKRIIYSLKPEILKDIIFRLNKGCIDYISIEIEDYFLKRIGEDCPEEYRIGYMKTWNSIGIFDFLTFYKFIADSYDIKAYFRISNSNSEDTLSEKMERLFLHTSSNDYERSYLKDPRRP